MGECVFSVNLFIPLHRFQQLNGDLVAFLLYYCITFCPDFPLSRLQVKKIGLKKCNTII